jgi:hypothetical protein
MVNEESESPSPAETDPASELAKRQRTYLAADLAEVLTWLHNLMTPEGWAGVSSAMSLLTGQSLDQRLSAIFSAVTTLPNRELAALLALFRDVGADLAAGRGHRPLSTIEEIALERLRHVLASV